MKFVGDDGEFDVEAYRFAAKVTLTAARTVEVAGAARERVRGSAEDEPAEPAASPEPGAEIDLREQRARTHE